MRLSRAGQFFREAVSAVRQDPQVKAAVRSASAQLVRGLVDGFEPARAKPAASPQQRAANADYVNGLYRELLGREADPGGFAAHMSGLDGGTSRAQLRQVFLDSPEYQALQRQPPAAPAPVEPPPAPAPVPAPRTYPEPGPALATVPPKPEYLDARVDRSSEGAAVLSAARWVKQAHPEYFNQGDDRNVAMAMMADVIGALRAAGYDAHRVVNHPSRNDALRYGSDALVVGGNIYDVYGSWGDPNASTPQALNQGPYAPGRLRE